MIERNTYLIRLDSHGLEERPGIDKLVMAVRFGECPQRKSPADFLLVFRMNVIEVADVSGDCHSRVGQGQRFLLSFPYFRQIVRLAFVTKWSKLYKIERHVIPLPRGSPSVNQRFHLLVI